MEIILSALLVSLMFNISYIIFDKLSICFVCKLKIYKYVYKYKVVRGKYKKYISYVQYSVFDYVNILHMLQRVRLYWEMSLVTLILSFISFHSSNTHKAILTL